MLSLYFFDGGGPMSEVFLSGLEAAVGRMLATTTTQTRVRKMVQDARKRGGSGGIAGDRESADHIVETIKARIADAVFKRITFVYDNAGHHPDGLFDVAFDGTDDSGDYVYYLNFKPHVVHRSSLWPEGYPKGLENIVAMYSRGTKPSQGPIWNTIYTKNPWGFSGEQRPYGKHRMQGVYREGRHYFIRAGYVRPPDAFLRDCVAGLNAQYSKDNVKIKLDAKYYP